MPLLRITNTKIFVLLYKKKFSKLVCFDYIDPHLSSFKEIQMRGHILNPTLQTCQLGLL